MDELELIRESGTQFDASFSPSGGYEECPDTFHLQFDPEAEPVAHAVVKAASFVHNVEVTDLSPLATVIDPEALDTLVTGHGENSESCVEVQFAYEDLLITVSGEGDIWLTWS